MSTDERKASFLEAMKQRDINKMQELIKEGVNINELDEFGLTPLHFCVISGFDDGAKLLLENGAQVNSLSSRNTTPLHHAAKGGHLKCLEVLLEHNADVMVRDESTTPFGYAVKKGHIDAARALIAAAEKQGGAEMRQKLVNLADSKGDTPLMLAVGMDNIEFTQELVRAGASIVKDATETNPASCILSTIKFDAPQDILAKEDAEKLMTTSVFIKQIAALREEGSNAAAAVKVDLKLKVKNTSETDMSDGDFIGVHKAVVAARSPFFAALLKDKPDISEETIDCVTLKQLGYIVDWMYKNTLAVDSFSDTFAVYCAGLRLFQEDEGKEATPLFLLADSIARGLSATTLKDSWKAIWDEANNDHETVKLLRQHALFFVLNKLNGAAEESDVLELVKTTSSTLLADTLLTLKVYVPPKEVPAPAVPDSSSAAPVQDSRTDSSTVTQPVASVAGGRVNLLYSQQCPQDIKDDIAETEKQLGALLNLTMASGHLSLARKVVSAIVKSNSSIWFRAAVVEERDGAPGYYTIIKYPMDLTSLRAKYLDRKPQIVNPVLADFINDGRTIWQNAMIYNRADSPVFVAADKLAKLWEKLIRTQPWANAEVPSGMKRPSVPVPAPNPVKKPAPAPVSPSPAVVPMTNEELTAMTGKILEIQNAGDTDALMTIVKMANANPSSGEVELDFAKLSPEILRKMQAFVNTYEPKKL